MGEPKQECPRLGGTTQRECPRRHNTANKLHDPWFERGAALSVTIQRVGAIYVYMWQVTTARDSEGELEGRGAASRERGA